MKQHIEEKLKKSLVPSYLRVIDVSSEHRGHNNFTGEGETHFKIEIRADLLNSITLLEGHKKIFDILGEDVMKKTHSISLIILPIQ